MSLEGKLLADFSSVPSEAEKAIAALGRMETGATKAAASIDRIKPSDGLTRVTREAPLAAQALTGLTSSLSQFDSALAAVGIHIGPEIRGIGEMGTAAGAAEGEIGALGIAGLALGAGIAGWKVGRAAADFLDLDHKIADATARLIGFGDIAGQKAAYRAEILAKASKTAGYEVTNLSNAMAINEEAAKAAIAANTEYSDSVARVDAAALNAKDLAKWNAEITTLKRQGLLDSLTADLNTHAFSMQTLATRYKISTEALNIFAKTATETARIEENNSKKLAALRLDEAKSLATLADRKAAAQAAAVKKIYDEIEATMQATEAAHAMGIAFDEAQTEAKRKTDEATAALEAEKKAADDVARSMGNSIDYDLSTPEGMAQFKRLNPTAAVNAPAGYFDTHSLADAVRDGLVNFYAGYNTQPGERSGAVPAPLVSGGYGSRGAQLVGPSVPVNVQVSGVWDPATARQIGDVVGQVVMAKLSFGTQFGPR